MPGMPVKVGPVKTPFPGDTVKVQDPPTSNGASTDAFGDDKGLKAPPGARGEFVEGRPPGNIGVPLNPVSPTVNDTNRRRREGIPPMYLPQIASRLAQEDVDNEGEPEDDEEGQHRRQFEQGLISRPEDHRRAVTVYPIPQQRPPLDERLLLQIPSDMQERYADLHRRVNDYVRQVKLNTLDLFDFPADPPPKWIEEERLNVPVDWSDDHAWASYLGRLSHDDVADWLGLDAMDAGQFKELSPELFTQHALEAPTEPFHAWFRSQRPALADAQIVQRVKESAQAFPEYGLGKGYAGYWRRRNHEMVRTEATRVAKERHDRYLREVDYPNHVRPHLKDAFDAVNRARTERTPLSDMVSALHGLPFEDRDEVDGFDRDYEGMISEGVHALDLYREPVSRDDRLVGDMEYMGERLVPISRIHGHATRPVTDTAAMVVNEVPVPLYRYGSVYFLAHEGDWSRIAAEVLMVKGHVYNIKPGSSHAKRVVIGFADWERKSNALAGAIREIQVGGDREATFTKYGRDYGPGLRKAVSDYLYITQRQKQSDGGGGDSGSTIGDSTCSSFTQQSPDNCDGCTFNSGTGGPEFGYGDGACTLTQLFLNAPEKGFGRGEQSPYNDARRPGTPGVQPVERTRQRDPRNF